MGDEKLSTPGAQGSADGRPRGATPARQVPLVHPLLCLIVVALGLLMALQGQSAGPTRFAAPHRAASQTPAAVRVQPLAAVADAVMLRGAFSVVPDLRPVGAADSSRLAGPAASVSAPLVGASGLRPAGLLLRSTGISAVLWAAYEQAARRVSPRCHLQTSLLAAIGEVESGSLAGRRLDPAHNVVPPVLGPVLSGGRVAAIRDTDGGRWDGDSVWDRAVGPMQFIPGTWRVWGSDGNGDGMAHPQNVEDAAYSAARYLCAGGRDLSDAGDLRAAILSYNRSLSYLARVLELMGTIEPGSLPNLPTLSGASSRSPAPTASSTRRPAGEGTSSPAPPATTAAGSTQPVPTSTQPADPSTSSGATGGPSATPSSANPSTSTTYPSVDTASGMTTVAEGGTPVPPSTP